MWYWVAVFGGLPVLGVVLGHHARVLAPFVIDIVLLKVVALVRWPKVCASGRSCWWLLLPVPALRDILVDFTEQLVPLVHELILSCTLGGLSKVTRAGLASLVGHNLNFAAGTVLKAAPRSPVLSALQLLEA